MSAVLVSVCLYMSVSLSLSHHLFVSILSVHLFVLIVFQRLLWTQSSTQWVHSPPVIMQVIKITNDWGLGFWVVEHVETKEIRGKKKFTCNKNWSSRISCSLAPVLISSQCPYALECSMPLPCSMWFAAVCATDLSTLGLESDKLEKPVTHTHRRRSSQGRVELPVLRPLPKSLNNDMKLVRIYVENNNRILTLHWHEVVICMCHDDEVHFRCISL